MAEIGLQVWREVVAQLETTLRSERVVVATDQTDSPYNATAALAKSQGKACLIVACNVDKEHIKDVLKQLDLFAGTPSYVTAEIGFETAENEKTKERIYCFQIGGTLSTDVVWEQLQGMQQKLQSHTVPTGVEGPIKKWMISKDGKNLMVQDAQDTKDPKKEYIEGLVSINELCIDPATDTLGLSREPIKLDDVVGLAIFGYTG